jgi:curli biogenesis system outer membrane secretion channel CsgG
MNTKMTRCAVALVLACLASPAWAQPEKPKLKQLGVGEVTPTKSLRAVADRTGQTDSLDRLIDSVNEHIIVRFQGTRKFDVIARSDLGKLVEEQGLPKGLVLAEDAKSLPGLVKGLDYMLVTTITDFKDQKTGLFIEGLGTRVDRREVSAVAVVKIYNTTTGSLMEAIDVPVRLDEKGASRVPREGFGNRAVDDSLIEAVAVEVAQQAAQRVVSVLFPARVLAVTDDQVTLNRGEGTDIVAGQVWEVFATGKVLVDPETGEKLGEEEVKIGEVRIESVLPKLSRALITGDNRGIAVGAIARLKPGRLAGPGRDPRDFPDPRGGRDPRGPEPRGLRE